jgi:CubicO group peptidase (beta-lactamase class C family)
VPDLELYSGRPQHDTFCRMGDLFPARVLQAAAEPIPFPLGEGMALPASFEFEGTTRSTERFLVETDTSALLVLREGSVCFERYMLTGGEDVRWISWSVAKSFISALVGIALDEGLIADIADPIDQYVPAIGDSAYAGVSIKDVLQMSSGARWSEDYSDPDSDVNRFAAAIAGGQSLEEFVAGMSHATRPGTLCQYNSADTQALGFLLVAVTGRSIADYMQEKLVDPLGMQCPGYWLVDSAAMEMAFGGLNLCARDYARIGELFRNDGRCGGKQVVPEQWVRASVTPDAPHLRHGKVLVGGHVFPFGYGHQWWTPEGDAGEFSAIGVYNQFVYVNPSHAAVIVKLSANRSYGTSPHEATNREAETIELLRAIARIAGGAS